jgi:DNA-binding response OmpR family regulator
MDNTQNKKNILIIEDDSTLQDAYQKAFEKSGYNVILETKGSNGLQKAKSENPALIILDLMLAEGINGFDVLEQLKKDEDLAKIPVFVLTNLDSKEDTVNAIGAEKCFVKTDIFIEDLIKEIDKRLAI